MAGLTVKAVNTLVRERLLAVIKEVRTASGWKVLVVDQHAVRVISSACKMGEIIEEGVTLVEKLEIERQPDRAVEALYLMAPTESNIDRLLQDFPDPSNAKYAYAHVYFTTHLPNNLLSKLKHNPFLVSKVRTMRELHLQFLAVERLSYTLDLADALHNLFSSSGGGGGSAQNDIVTGLLTVCVTLCERPIIRAKKDSKALEVANRLNAALDHFDQQSGGGGNSWFKPNRDTPATLLLVDRSDDPLSPLLHEYTYQAMVNDVIPLQGDRYTYQAASGANKEKQEKTVFLNEADPLWVKLRHLHIADAINTVLEDFDKFTKENKAAHMAKGGEVDLKQMSDAIRSLPQYTELLGKYSMHIELTRKCMKLHEDKKLEDVSTFEQNMAVGQDPQGKTTKKDEIVGPLVQLLSSGGVEESDRIRLVMVFIITQEGVTESDIDQLVQAAKFTDEDKVVQALANLRLIGVQYKSAPEKPSGMLSTTLNKFPFIKGSAELVSGLVQMPGKSAVQTFDYDLSRYRPPLQFVMQDALNNKLDTNTYHTVGKAGGGGGSVTRAEAKKPSGKAGWASGKQARDSPVKVDKSEERAGPRLLVFCNGGVCFSELRAGYELSNRSNRDVVIGSTEFLNPSRYVESISALHTDTPVPKHDSPEQRSDQEPPPPPPPRGEEDELC